MRRTLKKPPSDSEDVENAPRDISAPQRSISAIIPRLVTRNLIFSQSSNDVNVRHQYDGRIFWLLLKYDWFHLFLRGSIVQAITIMLTIWTGMILLFAAIYMAIDDNYPDNNCGLHAPPATKISYHGAFAFSLETCKYSTNARSCRYLLIRFDWSRHRYRRHLIVAHPFIRPIHTISQYTLSILMSICRHDGWIRPSERIECLF
jgi:hypothetical protein